MIRKAETKDINIIMEMYNQAKKFMAQNGNPTQWVNGYPSEDLIRQDILSNQLFVVDIDNQIEAVFVFMTTPDTTYNVIENGNWLNDFPYGTLHRIVSRGRVKRITDLCIDWAFDKCHNLRCDTHNDNIPMQKVLERNGFKKCGIIYVKNGSPRIAYQKIQ